MTLPFAASFTVAPAQEAITLPAYNPDTQMSENFAPCYITSKSHTTYCGTTYYDPDYSERDCQTDWDEDYYCGY